MKIFCFYPFLVQLTFEKSGQKYYNLEELKNNLSSLKKLYSLTHFVSFPISPNHQLAAFYFIMLFFIHFLFISRAILHVLYISFPPSKLLYILFFISPFFLSYYLLFIEMSFLVPTFKFFFTINNLFHFTQSLYFISTPEQSPY